MATVLRRSNSDEYSRLGQSILNAVKAYRNSNEFNSIKRN